MHTDQAVAPNGAPTTRRALPQPLQAAQHADALLKIQTVIAVEGSSASSVYRAVADQLLPPPIKLSARCSRWVAGELQAVRAARIAGKSPDQIRALVRDLVAKRAGVVA